MWLSTVEVTREAVVAAPPERAWSLVSDSAAWSLRRGSFAFDVPEITAAGRLRCWCFPLGQSLRWWVLEVREEIPGQLMRLESRGVEQESPWAFTLSVQPHERGATIRLTVSFTVQREQQAEYRAFWRRDLRAWLSALADVAEGRRAWPGAGIPADLRQQCADLPALTSPQGTSAVALIHASPDVVWRTIRAPGVPADPRQPYTAVCGGRVPGSPERQASEMPYLIVRQPDGRLPVAVSIIRELSEGRSVLAQRLDPPHYEMRYRVEPAPAGTRLELTMCWPDARITDQGEQLRGRLTRAVQDTARAYQAAIEGPAGRR
jgi:hypothetical protein